MASGRLPGPQAGYEWYWPAGLTPPRADLAGGWPPPQPRAQFAPPGPIGMAPSWMPAPLRLRGPGALYKRTQDDLSIVPNHRVVLRSRITFAPALAFEIFTWGQGNDTVPQDPAKPMSIAEFLDHYHGFVAAKL